jgi:hypothetical protein
MARMFKKILAILILIFVLFQIGCVSQIVSMDEYTSNWMGRPIDDLRDIAKRPTTYSSRINWNETTYRLEEGNWAYIHPVREDCFVHWEVNPENIIIDYKIEGNKCY